MAEKTMSIEQMEETLLKLHGKPDGKVAEELESAQLTERVSPARLARWEADFTGQKAREELMKLSDMSAFLDPPASDVLRDPPPDEDTQRQMLEHAIEYTKTTITRLPKFYATRETTHFQDTITHKTNVPSIAMVERLAKGSAVPLEKPGGASITEYRGLHSTGEFSRTVTYRDGHEVLDEETEKQEKEEEPSLGLTSSGEFGPILGIVINDVAHTEVAWARWEQGNGEPAAVFRYAVPASQSHFKLEAAVDENAEALFPAYHGEIEIDPATGEILRLSEVADSGPQNDAMRAAIVVEYGPVKIGDQSYICPVRGVAFSMVHVLSAGATDVSASPVQTNLNDIAFTNYHELGSEARTGANTSPAGEKGAGTVAGPDASPK